MKKKKKTNQVVNLPTVGRVGFVQAEIRNKLTTCFILKCCKSCTKTDRHTGNIVFAPASIAGPALYMYMYIYIGYKYIGNSPKRTKWCTWAAEYVRYSRAADTEPFCSILIPAGSRWTRSSSRSRLGFRTTRATTRSSKSYVSLLQWKQCLIIYGVGRGE